MNLLERLVSPARQPMEEPALLCLLHGLGSNEADLFEFATELDQRLTVVSYRAPVEYEYGGFAWFDIRWTETSIEFSSAEAQEQLDNLIQNLQGIQVELGVRPERTILGGFSQGAMVSLGALIQCPQTLGGAMLLSSCLVPGFVTNEDPISLPVFQSHGTMDPVLRIELGRQVRDLLTKREAHLDYHEYVMGHEVSFSCLRDAKAWLSNRLDAIS